MRVKLCTEDANFVDEIEDMIDGVESFLATIGLTVDDVETLIGTTNTKLDSIIANTADLDINTDTLEALGAAGNSSLSSIDTNLGSLTKTEDLGHSSGDKGVMALAVRNDAGTTLANTTLDYAPLGLDANGDLRIVQRAVSPGTAAANLGKAEDDPHNSGDVGVMSLAVRKDTAAAVAADGDYHPLTLDSLGQLRVNIGGQSGGYLSVVDQIDTSPGPVLNAANTTIQDNAGAFVVLVASLAAACKRIKVSDTTGEFLGIYTGGGGAEVLAFIIGPGMDDTIEHSIAAATRITVRSMDTTDITEGKLCLQFLG